MLSVSAQPVSLIALARAGCVRPSFPRSCYLLQQAEVTVFNAHILAGSRREEATARKSVRVRKHGECRA